MITEMKSRLQQLVDTIMGPPSLESDLIDLYAQLLKWSADAKDSPGRTSIIGDFFIGKSVGFEMAANKLNQLLNKHGVKL